MSHGYSDQSTRALYRAALIAIPIGPALGLVIVIVSGEFDWKWLLAAVTACAILAAFVFAMYRWARPLARRLRNRLEGFEYPPPVKQSEEAQREWGGRGEPEIQRHVTTAEPTRWYKRVRVYIVWGLTQPVVVGAVAAAFLGNLIALMLLGLVLGVCVALVWSFIWTVQREELERRGIRW